MPEDREYPAPQAAGPASARNAESNRSIRLLVGCLVIGFVLVSLLVTLICVAYIYKRYRDLQPPPKADAVLDVDDCLPIDWVNDRYVHLIEGPHAGLRQYSDYILL